MHHRRTLLGLLAAPALTAASARAQGMPDWRA